MGIFKLAKKGKSLSDFIKGGAPANDDAEEISEKAMGKPDNAAEEKSEVKKVSKKRVTKKKASKQLASRGANVVKSITVQNG